MSARLSSATRNGPRILLAGLLMALVVVAWPAAEASAATHQITIKNYAYGSGSMTISQGDTVTWTNQDSVPHDVVVTNGPAKFRSPMLTKGKSWSYTFSRAGAYSYTCSVHPDMNATINAQAKAAAPASAATAHTADPSAAHTTATPTPEQSTPTPSAAPASAGPPAAGTTYAATAADPAGPSMDPLLLLLGLSTAIVVFCMLLMASRPQTATIEAASDDD